MPTGVSEKCRRIAPSATLAMDAKAKELCAAGVDVISYAAGEPDFDTPKPIRDAMKEAMDLGMTRYTLVPGTLEVRDAIRFRFKQDYGLDYERDQVIVSNGAKQSLYTIFQTILNPGDEVIIPTPCWVSYPEMVRMAGGTPVFVAATEAEGFIPPISRIAQSVTPHTKAFMLTTPNNPNGCVWPQETLQALGSLAVSRDFYIISDEIYENLIYDGKKQVCIATLGDDICEHTLLVNGVSKSYAMTGFRIGYTAGPRDVIKAMGSYQSQASSAPNAAAQHASAIALTMPQDCVEEMRKAFEERRDLLVQAVNQIPGLSCLKPEGAFYVMINLTEILGKKYGDEVLRTSEDFARVLLEKAHVVVVPGSAFMAEGYCRLSYAISTEKISEGLRRVAGFVKELK